MRTNSLNHFLELVTDSEFMGIEQEQYQVATVCKALCGFRKIILTMNALKLIVPSLSPLYYS
jgi:hypothetical protein